jgi:hypothetical protein
LSFHIHLQVHWLVSLLLFFHAPPQGFIVFLQLSDLVLRLVIICSQLTEPINKRRNIMKNTVLWDVTPCNLVGSYQWSSIQRWKKEVTVICWYQPDYMPHLNDPPSLPVGKEQGPNQTVWCQQEPK